MYSMLEKEKPKPLDPEDGLVLGGQWKSKLAPADLRDAAIWTNKEKTDKGFVLANEANPDVTIIKTEEELNPKKDVRATVQGHVDVSVRNWEYVGTKTKE
jgi:hypothetical protein